MVNNTSNQVENFLQAIDLDILKQLLVKHYNGALISKPMLKTFGDGKCAIVYISCLPDYPYGYAVNVLSTLDIYIDQYHSLTENPAQLTNPQIMFPPTFSLTPDDREKIFKYAHTLLQKPSNVNENTLNSYRQMLLNINNGSMVNGKTYAMVWADRLHKDAEQKYNVAVENAKNEHYQDIHKLDIFKNEHGLENYFSDPSDDTFIR